MSIAAEKGNREIDETRVYGFSGLFGSQVRSGVVHKSTGVIMKFGFQGEWEKEIILWAWMPDICRWRRFAAARNHKDPQELQLTAPEPRQDQDRYCLSGWYKEGPPNPALPWIQAAMITARMHDDGNGYEVEFADRDGGVARVQIKRQMDPADAANAGAPSRRRGGKKPLGKQKRH